MRSPPRVISACTGRYWKRNGSIWKSNRKATPLGGQGDDGHFLLQLIGSVVTSVEGAENPISAGALRWWFMLNRIAPYAGGGVPGRGFGKRRASTASFARFLDRPEQRAKDPVEPVQGQSRGACLYSDYLPTLPEDRRVSFGDAKRIRTEGFQVVASAVEDMASMNVPDFVKRFQPPFPVGFSSRDPVLKYLQHPAMFKLMMPQLVFIDRQGTIRAQYGATINFSRTIRRNICANRLDAVEGSAGRGEEAPGYACS